MLIRLLLLSLILGLGALYSIKARKLTMAAAITGVVLALCVFGGGGFTGLAMMTCFFILGSVATSWKFSWKQQQGLAENEKGVRTAMQVIANAGVAALIGSIELIGHLTTSSSWWEHPSSMPANQPLLPMMMAAAFAAAAADTLSSELGNVYGSRFYNILSFKKGQRGLNGVVSLEGTLLGAIGSLFIGIIAAMGFGGGIHTVMMIVLAGTIGNIADSILGARLENKGWIGNNTVNFLNTAIAAFSMLALQ